MDSRACVKSIALVDEELQFNHNQLIIFPSHVSHAASPVSMDPKAEFMDGRFNIQFWLTAGLASWSA